MISNFMKRNIREAGIGVIEIFVLVGLLSAMGYYIMARQDANRKAKIKANLDIEIENMSNLIKQVLSDNYNCSATVNGMVPGTLSEPPRVPGGPTLGTPVGGVLTEFRTALKNPAFPATPGSSIFTAPQTYMTTGEITPGLLIDSIHLLNNEVDDFIRVKFKFTDRKAQSTGLATELNKDFILNTKKDVSSVTECNLKINNEYLVKGCTQLGGTINPDTNKCELADYLLRSKDLVFLYNDTTNGGFGYSTVPPPSNPATRECKCARLDMCTPLTGPACCTPATCTGIGPDQYWFMFLRIPGRTYITGEPVKQLIGGECMSVSQCIVRPISTMLKAAAP
jgi:hypothetical protein